MTNEIIIMNEPALAFRYGQEVSDPHDGLSFFGPASADSPAHPAAVSYALVGTPRGVELFSAWSNMMSRAWTNAPNDQHHLWPPFPGFEAAFVSDWRSRPVWEHILDAGDLSDAARRHDHHERVYKVVNQYIAAFDDLQKIDEHIGVMVCVVPDEIYNTCRIESHLAPSRRTGDVVTKKQILSRKQGQLEMFSTYDQEQYALSLDFRRQIKARAMAYNIPIQIIRESTLRPNDNNVFGQRSLTPLSDRMWNLACTMFYKAGGRPWRLATAREGVCYVGLAFRRSGGRTASQTAACAAQMFLDDGDGIVFLGNYGPWYSPKNKQFRLTKEAAKALLKGALDTYFQLHGKPLKEIFLHSRSDISTEEFEGYRSAALEGSKVVGIRVRRNIRGPRLYRPQKKWPILRGTLWQHTATRGFLYSTGFKPRLETYDGWEVPTPLQIDIQHGDAKLTDVARDILGLTKLNYNACDIGDSQPVTVKYSDAVGEILVSNPTVDIRQPTFKFYI